MQKIPKIIHYCWFGGNPHPELMQRCIQSWQRFCPDYELREWNEHTFDITANTYTRQAYEARRWAFVTDYVRLYALYTQGGIYMDTDVELLQPLDAFLGEEGFSGFESPDKVPTGLMAACKGQAFIGELLSEYDTRAFILPDGTADCTTNVEHITAAALRHGLRPDGTHQTVNGFTFYPSDYFCPIDFITMQYRPTDNTHAIHHFSGSWLTPEQRERNVRYTGYSRRYGKRAADALMRWQDSVQKRGVIRSVGKVLQKTAHKFARLGGVRSRPAK